MALGPLLAVSGAVALTAVVWTVILLPEPWRRSAWGWLKGWRTIRTQGPFVIIIIAAFALALTYFLKASIGEPASLSSADVLVGATFLVLSATLYFILIQVNLTRETAYNEAQMVSELAEIRRALRRLSGESEDRSRPPKEPSQRKIDQPEPREKRPPSA